MDRYSFCIISRKGLQALKWFFKVYQHDRIVFSVFSFFLYSSIKANNIQSIEADDFKGLGNLEYL